MLLNVGYSDLMLYRTRVSRVLEREIKLLTFDTTRTHRLSSPLADAVTSQRVNYLTILIG